MENSFTKTLLYVLFFMTIIIVGYIVGLLSVPTPQYDYVEAIKHSTINIENAASFDEEELAELEPLEENNLGTYHTMVKEEINPFTNEVITAKKNTNQQIITIDPKDPKLKEIAIEKDIQKFSQDPRVTIINPEHDGMHDASIEKLEIQISGQETAMIDEKKLIDDLSQIDKKQPQAPKAFSDPYAPRKPLVKAPLNDYTQTLSGMILPKSPSGKAPLWKAYSNPTQINKNKKPIAFVIGGLGSDHELTLEAIKTLPPEVTLGFVPYTNNLQRYIDIARQYGHEVILEIPMESHDFPREDAGTLALTISDNEEQYRRKLQTLLATATGYSGIMNYLGGKYMLDQKKSLMLMTDIKKYGLYFLENKTVRVGVLTSMAESLKVPYAASFDIVDEILSPSMINQNYYIIEQNALPGTPIIATTYLSRISLTALRTRLETYHDHKDNSIQIISVGGYIEYTKNNKKYKDI